MSIGDRWNTAQQPALHRAALGLHRFTCHKTQRDEGELMMRTTTAFLLTAASAALLVACGAPASDTPANGVNTNAAEPSVAAPTADALLALDEQAYEAYFRGDARFFESKLSDKFVMLGPGGSRMDKAATTRMIAGVECDVRDGWKLDEPRLSAIDADTYVLSYKGTFDGTCTTDGRTEVVPSPIRAATVWVSSSDQWVAAFHGGNPIVDPGAAAAPPAAAQAGKAEPTKDDEAAPDARPAAPAADPATQAMMAMEGSVWEAWKEGDAGKLEGMTHEDLSFIDIFGNYTANKVDTIKLWTEHRCEVRSVSVTDGVGTSLSPAVGILTFKGTADGTCYGQKIGGPIHGTSVYARVGDAWKLAFTLNHLPDEVRS
jgi:hypothetical protein